VEANGLKVAYIHFWYMHQRGPDALLRRLFAGDFRDADALVLDLRGRGGSAQMVGQVLRTLTGRRSTWNRPVVALIDGRTRSAKELLALQLQSSGRGVLVGQTTAGALLPASFASVGGESVLMFPSFSLGRYTQAIEGHGVAPDVEVAAAGPFSAGADPIREAGIRKAVELAAERARSLAPAM
jgi:C-terminal processing protease CtpA/Prc